MISRRLLRIKILQVLYARFSQSAKQNNPEPCETENTEKVLDFSVLKAYELYYYVLLLAIAVKRYAESRIDIAMNKKLPTYEDLHPNTRFVDNEVIQQLQSSQTFHAYLNQHKLSWVNHPELIKHLYLNLIQSDYYKQYMDNDVVNYEKDKELLIYFFTHELENSDLLSQIMEEQSIFWNDDMDFVVTFVVKTIKGMQAGKEVPISPMYKSDADRLFAHELLRATIKNYSKYEKLIEKHVENWDVERMALTDKLIMQMAINELVEFPFIPINVTFDEYIELPKSYSTPKSSVFINGLLDKISEELHKEGKIVKQGRGLIDE